MLHYVFRASQGNHCFSKTHPIYSCTFIWSSGDEFPPDGKILFKKPAKRSSSDKFQGITASSSKKMKSGGGEKDKEEEQKEVKTGKTVKNTSLLSFGGDEEEEED